MSPNKTFRCIVDDTALITNIAELESWVLRGVVTLVVPLHTLERLHLLKKDASQLGQNARKAVKFLDDVTSNDELTDPVVVQGPDEQYQTWQEVEAHYKERVRSASKPKREESVVPDPASQQEVQQNATQDSEQLPGMVASKMRLTKSEKAGTSPLSTPPLSPSSSAPHSSKTSPEIKDTHPTGNDTSPVPPALKDLINSVVWYSHERRSENAAQEVVFLTNSSDIGYLARDFDVPHNNIHQLRRAIGVEEQEAANHAKAHKKQASSSSKSATEPRTLFRYEDDASSEEEVVFKPRGRGTPRGSSQARGNTGSTRSRPNPGHSPANSLSNPPPPANKPQIPTEEIDPDSFDRGSFARGSTQLASVGVGTPVASLSTNQRTAGTRGNSLNPNASPYRGNANRGTRGNNFTERGTARGRGRLFVP